MSCAADTSGRDRHPRWVQGDVAHQRQAFFRVKEKVDPFPGVLSTEMVPP